MESCELHQIESTIDSDVTLSHRDPLSLDSRQKLIPAFIISTSLHIILAIIIFSNFFATSAVLMPVKNGPPFSVDLVYGPTNPGSTAQNKNKIIKDEGIHSPKQVQEEMHPIASNDMKGPAQSAVSKFTSAFSLADEVAGKGTAPAPDNNVGPNPGEGKVNGGLSESGTMVLPSVIPEYRHNAPPTYPMIARKRGHQGVVLISAKIETDGSVKTIQVKQSSGYQLLDNSALQAVSKWKFVPGRKMGTPVPMWVDIPIRFSLDEG